MSVATKVTAWAGRVRDWFDAKRRQAVYAAVAALAPVLVAFGLINEGQVGSVLIVASAGLQAIAGVLALVNLSPNEIGSWFVASGRAAIYAAAATLAPAAVALGWLTESGSASALTGVSLGLTALAALISVIYITPDGSIARQPRHAA